MYALRLQNKNSIEGDVTLMLVFLERREFSLLLNFDLGLYVICSSKDVRRIGQC